jgi:uncharacterized surface protein with fasciclin (FAS1) repeats
MYNIYTTSKAMLVTAVISFGLVFSASTLAGPDKPNKVKPGTPGDLTIVEAALATPDFSALVDAILCFGPPENNPIIDLLSGEDKYTVFAPNNAAFEALLEALDETDPCDLDATLLYTVLAYHVTDGRRFANSVFNLNNPKMIEMLAGGYIMTMPDFTIQDRAEQPIGLGSLINFNASNGVIHEINTVMLPIPPAD